jgi:hypothetical protein
MNTSGPAERHPSTRSAPGPAAGDLRRPVLTPVSTHAAASARSPAVNKVLRISPICCLTGDRPAACEDGHAQVVARIRQYQRPWSHE